MPATRRVLAMLFPEEELELPEEELVCCGANVETKAASSMGFETKNWRF